MRRLLLISLLALAPASTAQAGTVSTTEPFCPKGCFEYGSIVYAAAPGEANRVTMRWSRRGLVLRDAGAPITPGGGCTALDPHAVRCVVGSPSVTRLDLGDGDDHALLLTSGTVDGGDGADVLGVGDGVGDAALLGGSGDDDLRLGDGNFAGRLEGGDGNDRLSAGRGDGLLVGGAGDDVLAAGRGADRLEPGPGADAIDGGRGGDTLLHGERPEPLVVDLAASASAEDPLVRRVEHATGGPGDDHINGSSRANRLYGGGGADELRGAGGDDHLMGDAGADLIEGGDGDDELTGDGAQMALPETDGADVLSGGAGDDALHGGPGDDRLECGGGADVTRTGVDSDLYPAPGGLPRTDCEQIFLDAGYGSFCLRPASARVVGAALVLGNQCRSYSFPRRSVEVLDEGGAVLAAGIVRAPDARMRLALTPAGQVAMQPGVPLVARFSIGAPGGGPRTLTAIALAPRG